MSPTEVGQSSQFVTQFQTHGFLGWYCRSSPTPFASNLDGMQLAMQSTLPCKRFEDDRYHCATTGTEAPLGREGRVNLVGQPRFKDSSLCSLVSRKGAAAALAQCYNDSPADFLSCLWGSFSFSIIDPGNDRVLLGIDRLGQHPLYYHTRPDGLAWGTAANSVLACGVLNPKITEQGIYDYVYFHMVPSPGSIFQGLRKLPAAHCLRYENGQVSVSNYWQPQFRESSKQPFTDMCGELRPLLRQAVERAINGETAVGSFLSGGLDSSTVTGMLAEISERQARAFSIGFSAEGYDEMPYARLTARHFGVELNEYYVTPDDVVDALPLIAASYDEPFGNSSALPAYFCARFAAENGVKLLLAGDGGDEIFAGNERYARQLVFDRYAKIPRFLRTGLLEPVLDLLPKTTPLISKTRSYIAQANTPLPDRLQSYNFLHRHAAREIFTDDFLVAVDTESPLAAQRAVYSTPPSASSQNRMLYQDWQFTLADNDLRKVSHMCALAGIDVSYPMLDDELVEFSCTVPGDWKIKGQQLRHFYKESLKNWLPSQTINKSKQGFGLPFGIWMQEHQPLREMAYDNLINLKKRSHLRPEFIDKTIEMHRSGHAAYYGELVWILTVFELWLDSRVTGLPE